MKRILTFLLALVMCIAIPVSAENPRVTCKLYWSINGGESFWDNQVVKSGTEVTLWVEDFMVNGYEALADAFTFSWCENGTTMVPSDHNKMTVVVTNNTKYTCDILLNGEKVCVVSFNILADTVTVVEAKAGDLRIEADEDLHDFFYVYDCVKGNEIELSVSGTSVLKDADITYTWYNLDEYHMPKDVLSTEQSITVTKGQGFEYYHCKVSDGEYTKGVDFKLEPINTLDEIVTINGIRPKRFERGHMAVAKAGETVEMKVEASSTYGDVTFRWEKTEYGFDENDEWYHRVIDMGTSNTLTITKAKLESIDATETFECYVEDGNELIDVGFILFSLDPSQIIEGYEIAEETPNVTICENAEELANRLLQENMEDLHMTKTATITLAAEKQETPSEVDRALIEEQLHDSRVGMYMDLNLYKFIEGESEREEITETAKEISLEVELPEELVDPSANRTYEVIRVHEGVAETIPCVYNEAAGTVTFETDRFSVYAFTYDDSEHAHAYTWNEETAQYLCECGEAYTRTMDLDGNGTAGVDDAILLLRTIDGCANLLSPWAADVNGDGKVKVFDAVRYLQLLNT